MRDLIDKIQINMPFQLLMDQYLPLVLKEKINPEIGFTCFVLDTVTRNHIRDIADRISDAGLTVTLHAPFFDLRPGAIDRKIRDASIERLKQLFDIAPLFMPRSIVCHAAFDEKYYTGFEETWLSKSIDTWKGFIDIADDLNAIIALENVYEETPAYLARLFDAFGDTSSLRCCFDTGHCNTFSAVPVETWVDTIGHRIGEVHLHDNDGRSDAHAPVGDGTFPFHDFLKALVKKGISPIITVEPHTEKDLWRTLQNIGSMKLLTYFDGQ
jgi:sugar phosphate isomerase/epimerase